MGFGLRSLGWLSFWFPLQTRNTPRCVTTRKQSGNGQSTFDVLLTAPPKKDTAIASTLQSNMESNESRNPLRNLFEGVRVGFQVDLSGLPCLHSNKLIQSVCRICLAQVRVLTDPRVC